MRTYLLAVESLSKKVTKSTFNGGYARDKTFLDIYALKNIFELGKIKLCCDSEFKHDS